RFSGGPLGSFLDGQERPFRARDTRAGTRLAELVAVGGRSMRYKLTEMTAAKLDDLLGLIRLSRTGVATANADVRGEWDRIRWRFPTDDDARQGYTSLSEIELEELRGRVLRLGAERVQRPNRRPIVADPVAHLVPVSSADWQPSSLA